MAPPQYIPPDSPWGYKRKAFYYADRINEMFHDMKSRGRFIDKDEETLFNSRYDECIDEMEKKYGEQIFQAQWNAEFKICIEYSGSSASVETFGCPEPPPMTALHIENVRKQMDAEEETSATGNRSSGTKAKEADTLKTGGKGSKVS
ncbi:uncharacterized protein BP5553_05681 [Venustampulla echinocandica]|uniref:Uncharacterized protein n=1 Tax=Venustampulla echinocandica TaxID=2656787 RepID=A0A370TLD9_9HELO|nr:uncharacterized protein BP5553_05681 [Venustampulla echinocandica]RDL36329.1 hypothetical protein BP5553_05681 [Venustampulla echinocandica]